jgi:hypothetical protein
VTIKVSFESLETAFDQTICREAGNFLKLGAQPVRLGGNPDCANRREAALL